MASHEGEDGEESHGLGVEMQHMDLVMFEHRVEEGRERGNQARPKGINEDWDLGDHPSNASARRKRSHRLPHSLKLVASMGRTLSMASPLSTKDRPTAGSAAGGALGGDNGFFPLSACFGAMAMEQAERESDWRREAEPQGSRGIGEARRRRRRNNCVGRRGRIARRIPRKCGEAETPMSNQPPRVNRGRRLLGPAVLRN